MENNHKDNNYTVAGTNINQVKKLNDQSGMSYNEVKEWMAKNTGGHGTADYVRAENTRDFS
jgi:hypothetical protein